ncbi:cell division protein FtsZ [Aquimarina sp. U1-2]|uniref:cell division protein FtsZ n=1 Tax=Aquimarina sp. U1-2 TaxID=2823141 RepID=UPI001AECDFB7|nr:cell division protein FtsZ [Aquimarina sp. U1-2]MBP2833691.1 cell division protein FtsZ [Aquimarina sp. U1-2]
MSNNEEFENIAFDLPKNQSNVIKVIGVGGGGSNAINHMFQQGIKGVDFVICNTDAQALENSAIPNKIQLGVSLTEGLGAGANPEVGEQSAVESYEEIKTMLDTNTKMIFITAGMGGGTGTGAAPIIAKMAKELDILTVGIVTIPFQFEGRMRNEQAQLGVERLRAHVDSLIVINNNKLREVYGNLGFKAGFSKADEVLATASRGIAEVITHHYTQNIDLRDAKTVLSNSGTAIMGSAHASGNKRAHDAIVKALDSPLLNDNKITGAKNVLLLIVSGREEITIDEIGEINDHIQQEAGHGANIIMGVGEDDSLEDAISVTVIATGFDVEQQDEIVNTETKKIIHTLEDEQRAAVQDLTPKSTGKSTPILSPLPKKEEIEKPSVIKHKLIDEKEEADEPLIATTDLLKNINVDYEVVDAFSADNDFVIINAQDIIKEIEVNDAKEVEGTEEKEDQFSLAFDMPVEGGNKDRQDTFDTAKNSDTEKIEEEQPIVFDLSDDILDMEVNEPIEVIPANETISGGVRKYSLEDYMEEEKRLTNAQPEVIEEDEEVIFEKKTVAPDTEPKITGNVDPINQPISETLKARAAERREKMKEFNYKFRNSANKIDDIEKEPAYKRAGIDVDAKPEDSGLSRTSLGTDGNDDIQLRKNNSFLHDNVD